MDHIISRIGVGYTPRRASTFSIYKKEKKKAGVLKRKIFLKSTLNGLLKRKIFLKSTLNGLMWLKTYFIYVKSSLVTLRSLSFVLFNQDLEFEPYKWRKSVMKELYPLLNQSLSYFIRTNHSPYTVLTNIYNLLITKSSKTTYILIQNLKPTTNG